VAREPHVEVRHLRAFAMVVQELHFTRAAERLHLSQQALSAHIRHLEAEIGADLFHRTTRTVELTPAGQTLAGHVPDLLTRLDTAIRDTRRRAAGIEGELRVAHVPVVGKRAMEWLASRIRELPGLQLSTFEYWMNQAIDAVKDGRLDAALVTYAAPDPDLDAVTVRQEPFGVILGASHPAAEQRPVTVDALADSTLATIPREISPGFYEHVMAAFPLHARQQRVQVLKTLTHELFLGDDSCRTEIAAGRAFFVTPRFDKAALPPWATWRPIASTTPINVDLVWRVPVRDGHLEMLLDEITGPGDTASARNGTTIGHGTR